jgi:excisionase family DNA binding protein
MMKTELQGYMRKSDVAKYLGVNLRTISRLMRKNQLPFHKLNPRLVLFRMRDVDAAMDRVRHDSSVSPGETHCVAALK